MVLSRMSKTAKGQVHVNTAQRIGSHKIIFQSLQFQKCATRSQLLVLQFARSLVVTSCLKQYSVVRFFLSPSCRFSGVFLLKDFLKTLSVSLWSLNNRMKGNEFKKNCVIDAKHDATHVSPSIISLAAVLSPVPSRFFPQGALRDKTKNGCKRDQQHRRQVSFRVIAARPPFQKPSHQVLKFEDDNFT